MTRIIFSLCFCIATLASGFASAKDKVQLAENAPDHYTVVRGDTLWDISGRFLQQPWRWPEVWRVNRSQIKNPHLIYPGQVIMLDRRGPYLSIGRHVGDQRLSPRVRTEALDEAIMSIPTADIEPFLTRPLVIDSRLDQQEQATIVAVDRSRLQISAGDTLFAKNVELDAPRWNIYRKAKPIVDPVTKEILGYEARHLGSAKLVEQDEISTLEVISSVEEIGAGDKMLPAEDELVFAYMPHAPVNDIDGRIISIRNSFPEAGRYDIVTINQGDEDGVDVGNVLAIYRDRGTAEYKEDGVKERFDLPNKRVGLAFVFRVFDRVSYALVMEAEDSISIGDFARTP